MNGPGISGRSPNLAMTGTPGTDLVFINEEFYADAVTPAQVDMLLADVVMALL